MTLVLAVSRAQEEERFSPVCLPTHRSKSSHSQFAGVRDQPLNDTCTELPSYWQKEAIIWLIRGGGVKLVGFIKGPSTVLFLPSPEC